MKKLNIKLNIKKLIIIIVAIAAFIALFFIIKNVDKANETKSSNTETTQNTTQISETEPEYTKHTKKAEVPETTKTDIKRNKNFYLSVDDFCAVFQEQSKFTDAQMSEIEKNNSEIKKMLSKNKGKDTTSNLLYKKACQYFQTKDISLIKDLAVCQYKNSYDMMCEYKDVQTAYKQFCTITEQNSEGQIKPYFAETFSMYRNSHLILFQCNEYFVVIDYAQKDGNIHNLLLNQLQIPPVS